MGSNSEDDELVGLGGLLLIAAIILYVVIRFLMFFWLPLLIALISAGITYLILMDRTELSGILAFLDLILSLAGFFWNVSGNWIFETPIIKPEAWAMLLLIGVLYPAILYKVFKKTEVDIRSPRPYVQPRGGYRGYGGYGGRQPPPTTGGMPYSHRSIRNRKLREVFDMLERKRRYQGY